MYNKSLKHAKTANAPLVDLCLCECVCVLQDETAIRAKARGHIEVVLANLTNTARKIQLLEQRWPKILYQVVHSTLADYSNLDVYKQVMLQQLQK